MKRFVSRRNILRGAGVALALPWLESLLPRAARAQAAAYPKRFIPIFFPNGSSEFWRPAAAGQGDAWKLSPILEPLQNLKSKTIVLTNMENYSPHQADNPDVEPSHGRAPGTFLTCVNGSAVSDQLNVDEANGISVDQVIAQDPNYSGLTALPSMQVGLSTWYSYCDGKPCSYSRSISWKDERTPMYKDVDPLTIFNSIVGVAPPSDPNGTPDPAAQQRAALNKSVLDAVLENATRTRLKLGSADQLKLDEFLESVRSVEKRATMVSGGLGAACEPIAAPTMGATPNGYQDSSGGYDKGAHADVMNDLIVMALQCDVTRVISYMMEDERSEFVYSHVTKRDFTLDGSVQTSGTCGNYHGLQHAGASNPEFATINWWQSTKVAELCERLDAIMDGDGVSILDNSIVMYASCMHGGNHQSNDLPVALIGGGGGMLKTDQHVMFPDFPGDRPMRDLYYTILQQYFGINADNFGANMKNVPPGLINEILA